MTDDLHEELGALAPAPAVRELPPGRHQILKDHLMSEIRIASSPAPLRPRRRPRRRARPRLVLGIAAASLAAAAAVTVTIATSTSMSPPASPDAVRLLSEIANAAARQPALVVHDNEYEYLRTEVGPPGASEAQVWRPVADNCKPGLEDLPGLGDQKFIAAADGCPSIGSLNAPTYRFLQTLPLSPRTLLDLIYATERGHGPAPDDEAFVTIGDLIDSSIVPPQVSAALYRAAELIPAVTVAQNADLFGRHGVAVAYTYQHFTTEWVFDKTTLQYIGELDINQHGNITYEDLIVRTAFVRGIGQQP